MKSLFQNLLILFLLASSGCMTAKVVEKAKPEQRWNSETKERETQPGHPGYYALLPLSIPADIVTSPFQLIGIMVYAFTMQGH